MNNQNQIEGNWNTIKGKLKQRYAELSDNDILLEKGKLDELLGRLQTKLGKTKDEIETMISDLNDSKTSPK